MIGLFRDATSAEIAAGIKRTNNQVRLPITFYRDKTNLTATINTDTYKVGTVAIQQALDAVSEPRSQHDGLELYGPRKIQAMLRIVGVVTATSLAALYDSIDALNAAFDPSLTFLHGSSVTEMGMDIAGVGDLRFSVPTADTTNYASGYKSMKYLCRATSLPVALSSQFTGLSAPFQLDLLCPRPYRVSQTAIATALVTGSGNTIDNSLSTYMFEAPTVALTLSGDGGTLQLQRPAVGNYASENVLLDLSGALTGEVIYVEMGARIVYNQTQGAEMAAAYTSGLYWKGAPPVSFTVTVGGTATFSAMTFNYHRAWV